MVETTAAGVANIAHHGAGPLQHNNGGDQRNYDQQGGPYNTQNIATHLIINQQAFPSGHTEQRPRPSATSVPFRRDRGFVDRPAITSELYDKLALPAARVALVGLGGVGKTQLAVNYSYQLRDREPESWVLWIHASNPGRSEQSLRTVAEQLKIPGRREAKTEIFELLWSWLLDEGNGKWLIVLDNADDTDLLLQPPATEDSTNSRRRIDYLPECDHGSVLVTSRSLDEATKLVEFSDVIIVQPMEKQEALLLLQNKLGRRTDDIDSVAALAERLEYIPLAMTQAAAYILQRGSLFSVQEYLAKVREDDSSMEEVLSSSSKNHRRDRGAEHSVFSTWHISFERVHQMRRSAAQLLSLMSLCDRHAIPESLMQKYSDIDAPPSGQSREDSHGDSGHRRTSKKAADAFIKDVATLEGYLLITVIPETRTFEMHRLVQLATQQWLKATDELEKTRVRLAQDMYQVYPKRGSDNWLLHRDLYPHILSLVQEKPTDQAAIVL